MYRLEIKHRFEACHQLPDSKYLFTKECARPHGHSYAVKVKVESTELFGGMVVDFKRVKDVINELDHGDINLIFLERNNGVESTAENIALFLFRNINMVLPIGVRLNEVAVAEGYRGDEWTSWVIVN